MRNIGEWKLFQWNCVGQVLDILLRSRLTSRRNERMKHLVDRGSSKTPISKIISSNTLFNFSYRELVRDCGAYSSFGGEKKGIPSFISGTSRNYKEKRQIAGYFIGNLILRNVGRSYGHRRPTQVNYKFSFNLILAISRGRLISRLVKMKWTDKRVDLCTETPTWNSNLPETWYQSGY